MQIFNYCSLFKIRHVNLQDIGSYWFFCRKDRGNRLTLLLVYSSLCNHQKGSVTSTISKEMRSCVFLWSGLLLYKVYSLYLIQNIDVSYSTVSLVIFLFNKKVNPSGRGELGLLPPISSSMAFNPLCDRFCLVNGFVDLC